MALDSSLRLRIAEAISKSAYAEANAQISLHSDKLSDGQEFYWAAVSYAFGSQDQEKALSLFDRALESGHDYFWTNFQKANCLLLLGRVFEAIDCLGLAHRANPSKLSSEGLMTLARETARNGEDRDFTHCVRTMVASGILLSESGQDTGSNNAAILNTFNIKTSEYSTLHEARKEALADNVDEYDLINSALGESINRFHPVHFKNKVLLNSVPKAGTHLLKSIVAHMIGVPFSEKFLDVYNFNDIWGCADEKPAYFVGHLPFDLKFAIELRNVKHMLLIRDPAQLIIATARAAFDPRIDRPDYRFIRSNFSLREYVVMLARGYQIDGASVASFDQFLKDFMGDWLCQDVLVVDFDSVLAIAKNPSSDASRYSMERFAEVFGFDLPGDWIERTQAASNRSLSATFLPPLVGENRSDDLRFASDVLALYAPGGLAAYTALRNRTIFRKS